jgi:septum formation protein
LRDAGYVFDCVPADVDEDDFPEGTLPADLALYLARLKATAVADREPDAVVVAADTVVAFGDLILGKPRDADHARQMIELLSGTTHVVVTGVAVLHRAKKFFRNARVMSSVHMRPLSALELDCYVNSGDWQGKAGGYGIQDKDPFVTRIAGDHTNIIGLPMPKTRQLLSAAGVEPRK